MGREVGGLVGRRMALILHPPCNFPPKTDHFRDKLHSHLLQLSNYLLVHYLASASLS